MTALARSHESLTSRHVLGCAAVLVVIFGGCVLSSVSCEVFWQEVSFQFSVGSAYDNVLLTTTLTFAEKLGDVCGETCVRETDI
jgi:flagellar motor component MotA